MAIIVARNLDLIRDMGNKYQEFLEEKGGVAEQYYSYEQLELLLEILDSYKGELFFVICLDGESIEAVFPFQIVRKRCRGMIASLTFVGDFDIYAHNVFKQFLIINNKYQWIDELYQLLVHQYACLWDCIELNNIPSDDQYIKYFVNKFSNCVESPIYNETFILEKQCDQLLSSKKRRELNRSDRNLHNDYMNVQFDCLSVIDQSQLDELRMLHSSRQQEKRKTGMSRMQTFDNPIEAKYIAALLKLWQRKKWLRYYRLSVGNKLIAFGIFECARTESYFFMTAIDGAFGKYQPARILFKKALDLIF